MSNISKLQSAMEYLMTYGWAILIIAIVLIALFSLGVFSNNNLGTSCIPESGFLCTNITLTNILPPGTPANTLAVLTFTVGQAAGAGTYNVIVGITSQNTTNIVFFQTPVPYPFSIQESPGYTFPPNNGIVAELDGNTNSVTLDVGDGWIFYPATTQPNEVGSILASNAIGTSLSGYVWIVYNASSEYEPRILIQRIARFSAKVT